MPSEPITDITDQRRFSNALRLRAEKRINALSDELIAGERDLKSWQREMLIIVRDANLDQYKLSQGGVVSEADLLAFRKSSIRAEMLRQREYLEKFAQVIQAAADNGKDLNFIKARARMYAKSTQAMFWRGKVPVDLPQVPRDGQTVCRTNCRCRLDFQKEFDGDGNLVAVLVYWRLGIVEHCPDCVKLSREWNPKRFEGDALREGGSMKLAIDLLLMDNPSMEAYRQGFYEIFVTFGNEVAGATTPD